MAEFVRVGNVEKEMEDAGTEKARFALVTRALPPPRRTRRFRVFALASLAVITFLLNGAVPALGETSKSESGEPSYLFRIERIRPSEDVCALVRGDGQFHYERDRGDKDTIFEGSLARPVLEQLIHVVSADQLFHLRQENIPHPLIVSRDFDELLLSVLRPGQWQNLRFQTPETRQPFDAVLDPLMSWLDSLPKEKHHRVDEFAGRNNCRPAGQIALKTRPAKTGNENGTTDTGPAASPTVPLNYVSKSLETKISNSVVERTCLLVYNSGTYHMEKRSQKVGKHEIESLIIEGLMDPGDFAKLKSLVDSTEWRNDVYKEPPTGMQVREGTIALLHVPRGSHVQKLTFWHYVGPGRSVTSGAPVSENETQLLQKYDSWLQFSIDTVNTKPLPVSSGNDCAVQP
jgi:hypothetical protein